MTGNAPPDPGAIIAGLIAAVVVAVVELSAGIYWLGRFFDTTEPSAVLPQP
jgi:hypothetical protein